MEHSGLKAETEGLSVVAQDQVLNSRYCCKQIIKDGVTDKNRMCQGQSEIVEHIIYEHNSEGVVENDKVTVFWDSQIMTDTFLFSVTNQR